MSPLKTLIIDDCEADRVLVKRVLAGSEPGFEVEEARSRREAEDLLACRVFDVVISDYNILGYTGLEVLQEVHRHQPETPVILLTGTGSEEIAVAALKRGAADYVLKSLSHIKKLPATIATVMDRTTLARERATLAEDLRRSEEKYRSLVETAPEAIIQVSRAGAITFFSQNAERIFGFAALEVVGRPLDVLRPAAPLPPFWADGAEAPAHEIPESLAATLVRKTGEEVCVEISVSRPAPSNGAGVTAIIRDVTEKRRMEREIARLDRLAAVGEMTAAIAHEVRNPLAAIATSAGVLKQDLTAAGLNTETVEWILDGIHRIEGLLRRFFDFAKPLEITRLPCDVNDLIVAAVAREKAKLRAAGAHGVACLGAVMSAADPAAVVDTFLDALERSQEV